MSCWLPKKKQELCHVAIFFLVWFFGEATGLTTGQEKKKRNKNTQTGRRRNKSSSIRNPNPTGGDAKMETPPSTATEQAKSARNRTFICFSPSVNYFPGHEIAEQKNDYIIWESHYTVIRSTSRLIASHESSLAMIILVDRSSHHLHQSFQVTISIHCLWLFASSRFSLRHCLYFL